MHYNKIPYTTEPSPLKPLTEKLKKNYGAKMAKHIYSEHKKYNNNLFYNRTSDYRELMSYYMGDQSIERYKKIFDLHKSQDNSWLNIDWRVRGFATKRINIVIDMLMSQRYKARLDAIDQLAVDRKTEVEAKLKASFMLKDVREFLDPILKKNEELQGMNFKSLDDIEMYMKKDYKDLFAMDAEKAVEYFLETNDMEQIRKDCAMWLAIANVACIKTYLSKEGWPKVEFCSPDRLVVPRTEYEDFRDLKKIGYIRDIAYSSFTIEVGDEFAESVKQDLFEKHGIHEQMFEDENTKDQYTRSNDGKRIKVMDFSFITQNEDVYEFRTDDYGVKRMFKSTNPKKGKGSQYKDKVNKFGVPYRTNGKKDIYRDPHEVVISGTWVVGTDRVYNYKLEHNQDRDRKNLTKVHLPYHIHCPNMVRGKAKSLMEQVIPTLDDLQNYQLKLNQHVASAIPKGAYINLDALENASMTDQNGKTMDQRELLRLYFERGIVVGRDTDISGLNGNALPIRDLENGMAREVITIIELMKNKVAELDELLGLSEIMSASTPHPKTGAKVSQIVRQQANHALGHLHNGMASLYEKTSMATLRNYQEMLRRGHGPQLLHALGKPSSEFMGQYTQVHLHDFGFRLEVLPTTEEWQDLYADLKEAQKTGQIDITDYYLIRESDNLKEARNLMEMKIEKRKREAAEAEQANIQQNNELAAQSAERKAQMDIQVGTALEKAKQETIQVEGQIEMDKINLEYDRKKELELMINAQQGAIENKQIDKRGMNDLMRDSVKEEKKLTPKK